MNLPEDFIFSQSSLQDYVECARRFELKYIERLRWPAPEVDDMLEFERRQEQGQLLHQLIHQHLVGIPAANLRSRIDDADVQRWFEAYLQTGLDDVPDTRYPERTLTMPLGNYLLLAKFDLVAVEPGERALIIDWKTSRRLPRTEWLAKRMQTRVYRYVLAAGGEHLNNGQPIPPEQVTMVYWFAEHEGATRHLDYDRAQFETDHADLTALVKEIATRKDFPLTLDESRCRFCNYRSLCNRGETAGPLADWDADLETADLDDFQIDFDQIAEIEF